ncbi:hypothetical protein CL6EHI_053030B [Entamoeba histolytica]|nr:hypothetical protein CL6EHI_053030B [Entamoeba histolytica]
MNNNYYILVLLIISNINGSYCDLKEEDGFYCDRNNLVKCSNGDQIYSITCPLGCNQTTPFKTTCSGTSSCFYGYPGSFCELKENNDGTYLNGITVCHRNGLQHYYSCTHKCEQLTDSFAKCIPDDTCSQITTTSKTFGYCPSPHYPIYSNTKYEMALNDALARELQQELLLKSPYCPFMAYLTSCSIVYPECTSNTIISNNDNSQCIVNCNNYLQCSRASGISLSLDCTLLCSSNKINSIITIILLVVLFY